jgi:hypothetical protein
MLFRFTDAAAADDTVDKSSVDETGDDIDDDEEEMEDAIAAEKENVVEVEKEKTNDGGDNDVDKIKSELMRGEKEREICMG